MPFGHRKIANSKEVALQDVRCEVQLAVAFIIIADQANDNKVGLEACSIKLWTRYKDCVKRPTRPRKSYRSSDKTRTSNIEKTESYWAPKENRKIKSKETRNTEK